MHQGRPLSSNFSWDMPQRRQSPLLKLKRRPPDLRLKAVIYQHRPAAGLFYVPYLFTSPHLCTRWPFQQPLAMHP